MNSSIDQTVARLAADGLTVGVAESCTGGLLGGHFTAVSGSSKVFRGGIIAYHNDLKSSLLKVSPDLLAGAGSVSASTVEAMAEGARGLLGSDIVLAVSGIAGPTGGTEKKPVGTVWIACVGPGDLVNVHRIQAPGTRQQVRSEAVQAALNLLARNLDEAEKSAQ